MRSTHFSEDLEDDVNDYRDPTPEYRQSEQLKSEPEEDVDLDEMFEENGDSLGFENEDEEEDEDEEAPEGELP